MNAYENEWKWDLNDFYIKASESFGEREKNEKNDSIMLFGIWW